MRMSSVKVSDEASLAVKPLSTRRSPLNVPTQVGRRGTAAKGRGIRAGKVGRAERVGVRAPREDDGLSERGLCKAESEAPSPRRSSKVASTLRSSSPSSERRWRTKEPSTS